MQRKPLHTVPFLLMVAALMLFSTSAWAQDDFDFTDDGGDEGGGDGGDGFDFTDEGGGDTGSGTATFEMPSGDKPIIVVFFEPIDGTDQRVLDRLTEALVGHLGEFEDYDTVAGDAIKSELDTMDMDQRVECVNDAPCLAGLAKPYGISKVIVGRIATEGADRPHIALDAVDVDMGAMMNFIEFDASPRVKGQEKELRPAAYKLFDRNIPVDQAALDEKNKAKDDGGIPMGQLIAAISTAGGGLVLIGVGAYFGVEASGLADDFKKGRDNGSITQKQAKTLSEDAQTNSVLANVFYGLGGVALATSVVLFLIRPGDEIAEDQEAGLDFYVAPAFGPDGAGVSAGITF